VSALIDPKMLREALVEADDKGVRLEIMDGVGVWEVQPARRHIGTAKKIEKSIRPDLLANIGCGCVSYQDLCIQFADGSLKRPDISIFCREPDELDEAVTLLPEAVVEVVSRGSEIKDLEMNPPFYLTRGVRDVIVVDPYTGQVFHHRPDGVRKLRTPVEIRLECGSLLTA